MFYDNNVELKQTGAYKIEVIGRANNTNPNPADVTVTYLLQVEANPNDAVFLTQSVPATIWAGAKTTVTIKMQNTGNQPWHNNSPNDYSLGSQNPPDNATWGISRVSVGATPVAPGNPATFTFTITAPNAPGLYNFQWKMVQGQSQWFDTATKNIVINVKDPNAIDQTTSLPVGMITYTNGTVPDLIKILLGIPLSTPDTDPLLQNIKRDYQYDQNDRLITAPERTFQLDAEGNIKGQ